LHLLTRKVSAIRMSCWGGSSSSASSRNMSSCLSSYESSVNF
jgi:hypothetical protein